MASEAAVLIVGAGLGGLTLAQALRKQKIPFRLFERDPPDNIRSQGWAISIHQWLMDDLLAGVRDDREGLLALSPTAKLGLGSEGVIYALNPTGRKQLVRFGEGTEDPFIRADRGKLRDWLIKDINVEWGKRFKNYQEDAEGVTAFFEDGSSARGSVLVGADGISSRVRHQLLDGLDPQRLPVGIIVGELNATPEQYTRWLKLAHSWSVGFTQDHRLFLGVKSIADDRSSAHMYWMFGWADEKAKDADFWTNTASQEELHKFVNSRLDGIDPEYAEAFRVTPVEGMLHPPLQMRDMVPPALPKGRVTLLGDAIHAMVPFRGEGGNMAMKDALVLAKTLAGKNLQGDVTGDLKEFEAEMRQRAGSSVVRSRESTFMHAGIFDK